MKVLSRVLLLTVLAFSQLSVAGQDQTTSNASPETSLERVASLIHQLRTGDLQRFRIDLGADNFTVLKSVEKPLTEAEAKAELQKAKAVAPTIRFTRAQELKCHQVLPGVWIEQAMNTDKDFHGSIWSKRTLETVGTYSNDLWDTFARMAMENGLSDFKISNSSEGRRAELAFDSDGPPAVQYGSQSLVLSKDFYRVMRVSTEYKPVSGRNGFVVLIHDPHQSVTGRFALMQGLNTLLGANAKHPVEFLVEGAFPETAGVDYRPLSARALSDGGLAQRVGGMSESIRSQLIYSMLSTYLIDTPLAYRILYHRMNDIPAFAIDDNRYLKEVTIEAPKETDSAINTILHHLDGDSRLEAVHTLDWIETLISADAQQISDLRLLGYYREIVSQIGDFASIAQKNGTSDLSDSIRVVNGFAQSYEDRAKQYERALERNKTMLIYIKQEAARALERMPLAFIGNYHTWGIATELRRAGIGYVVIEPRLRIEQPSSSEHTIFDNFLINPNNYFDSVLHSNKGLAGLTVEQVDRFHGPYLMKKKGRLIQQSAALEGLSARNSNGKINGRLLADAVLQNASLDEATVEIAGGNSGTPPNIPRGAFAFFDESEGKRRLVLLGADDNRWGSKERYTCLERAIFDLPTGKAASATLFHLSKHYQDDKTGRVYYTSYDRSSKRLYLVETSVANAGALLSLSAIRRGGAVNVHVVVSDLIPTEIGVEPTNADNSMELVN